MPGVEHESRLMVEGLKQIREMIKETEDKIQELCKPFPEYPYVLTIPGFGPDLSARVLGAIGDASRFQNGKQVLKLAGLDLSADRSGRDSDKAIPQISKRGQGRSSLRAVSSSPDCLDEESEVHALLYEQASRPREKGIKTKMRVKLSAKMLLIAWTLMKKKEVFDPAYLNIE